MSTPPRFFYYLDENNQEVGPFMEARLIELRRAELIGEHTWVWTEGFEKWIPFNEVFPSLSYSTIKDKARRHTNVTARAIKGMSIRQANVCNKSGNSVMQHKKGIMSYIKFAALAIALPLCCFAYLKMPSKVSGRKNTANDSSLSTQKTSYSADRDRRARMDKLIAQAVAQRQEAQRLKDQKENEKMRKELSTMVYNIQRDAYEQQRAAEKMQQQMYQESVQRNLQNINANLREQNRFINGFYY